jgi:type VI secretion system Hcp family effector
MTPAREHSRLTLLSPQGRIMRNIGTCILLAIGLTAVSSGNAFAQSTESFMFIPGVPGDAIADRYENWIDVFSVLQSLDASGRKGSACSLSITKGIDSAGPRLWLAAVTGQVFAQIQLDVLRAGGDRQSKFYEVTLNNARITGISTTPDSLREQASLTAETMTLKVTPQSADGRPRDPVSATISCR